jgi:hypothetical protein
MAVTLTVTMVSSRVKGEGEAYNMQEYTSQWNHIFFTSHYKEFIFNHLQYLYYSIMASNFYKYKNLIKFLNLQKIIMPIEKCYHYIVEKYVLYRLSE